MFFLPQDDKLGPFLNRKLGKLALQKLGTLFDSKTSIKFRQFRCGWHNEKS